MEEVEGVANEIETLARRLLNAAWRRRMTAFSVPDVVALRDKQVVREIGYEDHTAEDLLRAEQWLAERHYIVPAGIVGSGTVLGDFYTVTLAGHAFREGAD